MPHVGNDGFSNCDKLCGVGNGYSVSCVKICPGFKISTEIPTALTAAIKPGSTAHYEVTSDLTAPIIVCILAAFVIALTLICLIRKKYHLWQRQRSIMMPVQEQHRSTACEELIEA